MFAGQGQQPSPAQIALAKAEARRNVKGFIYTVLTLRAAPFAFDLFGYLWANIRR